MTWPTLGDVDRQGLVTLGVVLLLVSSQAGIVLAETLTHSATAGTTYQTNSGLEVTLGADREVDASPFADNQTFADKNVRISSPGPAAATINNDTYAGDSMTVGQIDATSNDVTLGRTDLTNDVTVDSGTTSAVLYNVTLDDNKTDLEIAAASETNVTVANVPDVDGIQAVDSTGAVIAGAGDTSDNTAELTIPAGTYELRLQNGPSTLEIRDIVDKTLVENGTSLTVELEFYGDSGTIDQRSTTDGTLDMTGLPIDQRFSVSVDGGDEYIQRQILIPSLLDQQTAWLLPSANVTTVEPRFTLSDPSNQFDEEESEISLERPLDINGTTEFVPVAGDRIGINGFDTVLERDQRYRLIVRDPTTGATRELGAFTPTQSEAITLTVSDVEFDSEATVEGLEWAAEYVTNDNSADEIKFIFRDEAETQTVEYTIHERGNTSNVLTSGSASGNVTISEPIPPGEAGTVWAVEWETTRGDGEQLSATRPVSDDELPTGPSSLPQQWQIIISMLLLFGVAGLFGAANPGVGGIAVAGVGGLFFMAGWLPDATGGLMVLLALFVAVLSYVGRKARGATA